MVPGVAAASRRVRGPGGEGLQAVGVCQSPIAEALTKAKAAALKAVEMDDNLPDAHSALGLTSILEWDWEGAEKELQRSLALNPDVFGNLLSAVYLNDMSRFEEALTHARHAAALDPLSSAASMAVGMSLVYSGQYAEGIEQLKKTAAMQPGFARPWMMIVAACVQIGRFDEALEGAERHAALSADSTESSALRAYALAAAGRNDEARALVPEKKIALWIPWSASTNSACPC